MALLALSDEGIPLGIINQKFINRQSFRKNNNFKKGEYRRIPIEKKESIRWLDFIRKSKDLPTGNTQIVHIADREGDIYELYRDCHNWGENYLIRACANRAINKRKRRGPPTKKLFDFLKSSRAQSTVTVKLNSSKKGNKYRKAKLSIIYKTISIPPPPNKTVNNTIGGLPMLKMTALMAIERTPPKCESPIKWVLLTNMEISNLDEAKDKIKLYSMRWNIELLHKVMKSGFGIEKAQIRDGENLKKYITLKSILAWRIFWLTRYFFKKKKSSCELVLTNYEWEILFIKFNKGKGIPRYPPPIEDVYVWIGKLGGFIGRKGDGYPGFVSIWKGWMRFMDLVEDYEAFCG